MRIHKIIFACVDCGKKLAISPLKISGLVLCKRCHKPQVIPSLSWKPPFSPYLLIVFLLFSLLSSTLLVHQNAYERLSEKADALELLREQEGISEEELKLKEKEIELLAEPHNRERFYLKHAEEEYEAGNYSKAIYYYTLLRRFTKREHREKVDQRIQEILDHQKRIRQHAQEERQRRKHYHYQWKKDQEQKSIQKE